MYENEKNWTKKECTSLAPPRIRLCTFLALTLTITQFCSFVLQKMDPQSDIIKSLVYVVDFLMHDYNDFSIKYGKY